MVSVKALDVKYAHIHHFLKEELSPKRYEHSINVSRLAFELARRFGEDPERGYVAGLCHDVAREWSPDRLKQYMATREVSDVFLSHPVLLHAPAGAAFAREEWGIEDPLILQAIIDHTLGNEEMGTLSRVLFSADYLTPEREFLSSDVRDRVLTGDLDEILLFVTGSIIEYLGTLSAPVLEPTARLYENLKEKVRLKHEKKQSG